MKLFRSIKNRAPKAVTPSEHTEPDTSARGLTYQDIVRILITSAQQNTYPLNFD